MSDDDQGQKDEGQKHDLDRELIELLNELRVALPGVQVLFAFLLIVPFSNGWDKVTEVQRYVYFVAFLCAAISSAFLIAPSTYHRLRWREGDKEHMLVTGNRLAIWGAVFLAAGMTATVFLITDVLFKNEWAAVVASLVGGTFAWLWFGLALVRDARDRARGRARRGS
jgi:amino acid transporter